MFISNGIIRGILYSQQQLEPLETILFINPNWPGFLHILFKENSTVGQCSATKYAVLAIHEY